MSLGIKCKTRPSSIDKRDYNCRIFYRKVVYVDLKVSKMILISILT